MSELSPDRDGLQRLASASAQDGWVDHFASEWQKDRRLTARRFIELHPGLVADKRLVALLAFEEFRLRTGAGESPDSQTFLDRFRDCHQDLEALLAVYRFMGGESGLAAALRSSQGLEEARSDAPASEGDGPLEAAGDWPEPGQTVGGFKLLEMLGRGAYARVYLAEEPAVGSRRVVVKASLGGSNEAHTLGKLVHPNIVPIYSVQIEPEFGLTLICMPFLGRPTLHDVLTALYRCGRTRPTRGQDLLDALGKTPEQTSAVELDPLLTRSSYVDAVIHLGAQLADALAYTNGKSILHRDLKPSNVLLDGSGKPMLLDFNLSLDVERRNRRVGGTLGYAAPEILAALLPGGAGRAMTVDVRSDLYSLGVILYELLSGGLPYGKPLTMGTLAGHPVEHWLSQQQGRPRPLTTRNPDVGPELDSLIERCLAYDLERRPATASELAESLKRLLTRRSQMTRWLSTHRRTLAVAMVVGSCCLAAGGYAVATLPSYPERQFAAAEQARGDGDYESALVHLLAAKQHGFDRQRMLPLLGETHYRLAKRALADNDFAAARDHCTQAIEGRLITWQAYLLRARARFHLREFDLGLEDIDAAEGRRRVPQIYSARGDCMCAKYKWDSALRAYNKALEDDFSSAGLLNNMAFALINKGRREESLDYLDRAIAADARLADAYYQRATVRGALAVQGKQEIPSDAISDIETAIRLRPSNHRFYMSAAQLYARHETAGNPEDRDKAIKAVLTALRLGLDPAELPQQPPLAELIEGLRRWPEYEKAVADGSGVEKSDQAGLVDSLSGMDFDEHDQLAADH